MSVAILIKTLREELYFDITNDGEARYKALLTAKSTLQNISSDAYKIKIAFPYYLQNLMDDGESVRETVRITANGEEVPYTLRLLANYDERGRIINDGTGGFIDAIDSLVQIKNLVFEEAKKYTAFEVTPASEAEILIDMNDFMGFLYIGAPSVNYRSYNSDKTAAVKSEGSFFVVTDSVQNLADKIIGGVISKAVEIEDIKEFMVDEIQRYFESRTKNSDNIITRDRKLAEDVCNLVFSDENVNAYAVRYSEEDFWNVSYRAVVGICCEVGFDSNQTQDVTVEYGASPLVIDENGADTYNYIYFPASAKYRGDFCGLGITVDVKDTNYKHLLESNMDFDYDVMEKKYTYSSENSSQNELTFKLYYRSSLPRFHPFLALALIFLLLMWLGLVIVIAVIVVVVTVAKKKRRDKDKYRI